MVTGCHAGGRFSRKARMPSCPSGETRRSAMVSTVTFDRAAVEPAAGEVGDEPLGGGERLRCRMSAGR